MIIDDTIKEYRRGEIIMKFKVKKYMPIILTVLLACVVYI